LHDFVTQSTRRYLTLLEQPQDFLEYGPSEWGNQDTVQRSREIVQSVKVVNDLAERGIALIQECYASITRNEEQKQFLLQVVEDHHSAFPASTQVGPKTRTKAQ